MLVSIIAENTLSLILESINNASEYVDVFELRLDYIDNMDISELKRILSAISKPVIFTVRSNNERGLYKGDESQRLQLINDLSALNPDYLDIEDYVSNDFIASINEKYPKIKIIRSHHNFLESPHNVNLQQILNSMINEHVYVYKLCVMAESSIDNLHIFDFINKNISENNLIAHCMGELGMSSRILGAIFGNYFTYTFESNNLEINKKIINPAPGLVDVSTLINIYNYKTLCSNTRIYALIGDPVAHSVGHLFHNHNFKKNHVNAVYVKLLIKKTELKNFISVLKKYRFLSFSGFSITMPLKNVILDCIDKADNTNLDVINTVKIVDGKLLGINTDGEGALLALNSSTKSNINGKSILLLGAGGAATAIALTFANAGGLITIINRSINKSSSLANKCHGNYIEFDKIPNCKYDIIINTLPETFTNNNEKLLILINTLTHENTVFMDINYAKPIRLDNILSISGKSMFNEQAKLQYNYWCKQ